MIIYRLREKLTSSWFELKGENDVRAQYPNPSFLGDVAKSACEDDS